MTRGGVICSQIKVGDVHYEYAYGAEMKVTVIEAPIQKDDQWMWKSVTGNGTEIDYVVTKNLAHYGANLYDYQAYAGCIKLYEEN